MLKCTY